MIQYNRLYFYIRAFYEKQKSEVFYPMKRYGILALICLLLLCSFPSCKSRGAHEDNTGHTVSDTQTTDPSSPDESGDSETEGNGESDDSSATEKPGDLAQGEWDPQP
jgi:hypothetical protein